MKTQSAQSFIEGTTKTISTGRCIRTSMGNGGGGVVARRGWIMKSATAGKKECRRPTPIIGDTKEDIMKTLEEFQLIKEFLGGQGIKPTMAMVCATNEGWADLKFLAKEWRDAREAEIARQQEALEGLSEEELALFDKKAEDERRLEQERILYHSCGTRPEKSNG